MAVFLAGLDLVPHIWTTTSLHYRRWRSWTRKKKKRTKADLPQENKRKQLSRGSRVFGNKVWCVCACVRRTVLVSSVTAHPSDQSPELHQLRSASLSSKFQWEHICLQVLEPPSSLLMILTQEKGM